MTPKKILGSVLEGMGRARGRYRGSRGAGQQWEDLAAKHLEKAGYRILERNFRAKGGEIDFVAEDGKTLCFIEVKGRSTPAFGAPAESVTAEKQRRIWTVAERYLQAKHVRPACRFDVVAIDASRSPANVELLRGAFEGPPEPRPRL